MQKKCKKCGKTKPISEFYKHAECKCGVRSECIKCNHNYYESRKEINRKQAKDRFYNKWRKIHYQMLDTLKINGCSICGYNKAKSALVFHHVNSENKKFGIELRCMSRDENKIIAEVEKCILLCCNCHREIHELERKKD